MIENIKILPIEVNGEVIKDPNDYERLGAKLEPALDFDDFALQESSADMEARMLADKYVLGQLAILGQNTVFYGGPNVGKTLLMLWLLIQKVQQGEVEAGSVYYINADDTYKGIVEKKKLSEQHGFKMLVPGASGFKAQMLPEILRNRTVAGKASGCIVILDTLKKFTDLMSKRVGSQFGEVTRQFVANGGTIISLAHVNKHKNDDGESVHAGTTDIIDDADCAYIIDMVEDNGQLRTVKFRNIKDRGNVLQSAQYSYRSKGDNPDITYTELYESVQEVSEKAAREAEQRAIVADKLAVNHEVIKAIKGCIEDGHTKRTELIAEVKEHGYSAARIKRVLKDHTGTDTYRGHRWTASKGDRNATIYSLL